MKRLFFKKINDYFPETKKAIVDLIILVLSILILGAYLNYIDASEILYNFTRSHEEYNLDEIILTIALSSFFFLIFILRRFIDLNELIKKANSDPLLGLINRRKGSDLISQEIHYLKKSFKPASLIMFDIDDFKNINDTYGHDKGDYVLKEISLLIKNIARRNDILIRWGGEEFIVLCPNTSINSAYTLANRFKDTIASYNFLPEDKITASFGVIALVNNEDLRNQIDKADSLLYQSKKNGKNTVTKS